MTDRIIATGFNTGDPEGDLSRLAARLEHMAAIGCTGAEITATGLDAVIACRLIHHRVAELRQILSQHSLAYSLHAPIAINLMDQDHEDLMRRAAMVSMELAAEIGAKVVVLHPGRCDPKAHVDRLDSLQSFEIDQLGAVADRAAALGVQIAYENISPNQRVIHGHETSYSLDPRLLAAFLERLGHAAVMACLDISHAQQGAVLWGFDMLEACQRLAPLVGHIHFSDSTGIPATMAHKSQGETHFFGVGDMHAPKGYGLVDFDTLAKRLPVRPGTRIVIEIKRNFLAHAETATLRSAKDFAIAVNGADT